MFFLFSFCKKIDLNEEFDSNAYLESVSITASCKNLFNHVYVIYGSILEKI